MKKFFSPFIFLLISLGFSVPLIAQIPSRPEIVGAGSLENLDSVVTTLSQYFFSGRWDLLQNIIDRLELDKKTSGHKIDPLENFYFIVFLSREEGEEPKLIRFAWHKPAPEPYAARIPGRNEIFEIVLGAGTDMELKTSYASTERDNPLLTQVPKFVKKIDPAFLELSLAAGIRLKSPVLNFEVRRVRLPFRRAKVKISDIGALSEAFQAQSIKAATIKLTAFISYRDNKAKALAASLCEPIQQVQIGEGEGFAQECRIAVHQAYRDYLKAHPLKGSALAQAGGIEKMFIDAVEAAGVTEVKAGFDYDNIPLERFSFGLISAYMLGTGYAADRVRLTEDGYYAADPPKSPLAAAIINIHPIKYDPESAKMSLAERIRLFVGVVLSPDAGFCAGAGFALLRGLSVNAGMASMGIRVANHPRSLVVNGRAKTEPGDPEEPFRINWKSVAFAGFGFSF